MGPSGKPSEKSGHLEITCSDTFRTRSAHVPPTFRNHFVKNDTFLHVPCNPSVEM